MIDLFAAAGLRNLDISILFDEFLAVLRDLPHRNLAIELLRELIRGELKTGSRRNVAQARAFSEMLEQSILRYQNRAIDAAKVIDELIQLAKDMNAAAGRG